MSQMQATMVRYETEDKVGVIGRRVQAEGLKAALEWRRSQFQT